MFVLEINQLQGQVMKSYLNKLKQHIEGCNSCLKVIMAENGINSFPNDKFLDSFKLKEFADDDFEFVESSLNR